MKKDRKELSKQYEAMVRLAMDCMGVAVTIVDAQGTLLYFNRHAAEILDRKSNYLGTDVHSHHKKPTSNQKLDFMIKEFGRGREKPFRYEAKPYGKVIFVTLSPIRENGKFLGCVQSVTAADDGISEK